MRICSPQLGLSPKSILGGEIYDRQILKYLAKREFEIEICLPLFKKYEQVQGWHIRRIPLPFIFPPHLYNLLVLPYLISLYAKKQFDILRIHSPAFIGIAGIFFKIMYPDIKLVSTYHWLGEGGKAERLINPYLMHYSDAIICDSYFMKEEIEKRFSEARNKVHAIHNGVDEILRPQPKSRFLLHQLGILQSAPILLFMGLFIERKNPHFLLPLVKKLISRYPTLQLILCGRGPLKKQLQKNIEALHLTKHIRLVPPVFGEEKNNLLNLADIFVHPALTEGFSLAVVEAMACGLPVVITRGFSAAEAITDGINGFLCATSTEWYQKLDLLLKNKSICGKIKQANLNQVKCEFRWEIAAGKQASLFRKLVN